MSKRKRRQGDLKKRSRPYISPLRGLPLPQLGVRRLLPPRSVAATAPDRGRISFDFNKLWPRSGKVPRGTRRFVVGRRRVVRRIPPSLIALHEVVIRMEGKSRSTRRISMCQQRQTRKEVLFAREVAGVRGSAPGVARDNGKRYAWSVASDMTCRR